MAIVLPVLPHILHFHYGIIFETGNQRPVYEKITISYRFHQPGKRNFGNATSGTGSHTRMVRPKIDISNSQASVWHEEGCYPGEPVFVERPQATAEDDGLLLSIVLDAASQTSFLLLLDAGTMQEIARATTPQHITFGFHGQYLSGNDPDNARKTIHR